MEIKLLEQLALASTNQQTKQLDNIFAISRAKKVRG
jgi:hypothetical protein